MQPQKYAPKEKSALIRKKMSPPIQRKRVTIERKEKLFFFSEKMKNHIHKEKKIAEKKVCKALEYVVRTKKKGSTRS